MVINTTFVILVIALVTLVALLTTTIKNKEKNKLYSTFSTIIIMFIIHISGLILQVLFSNTSINPIYFEYIAYIGGMNFSVAIFIMACTYFNSGKSIKGLKKNYGKWLLVGLRWEKTEI